MCASACVERGAGLLCFIMFNKDTETNRNSLLGYYAEVRFGNDSPDIAELFMVSAEVAESSK